MECRSRVFITAQVNKNEVGKTYDLFRLQKGRFFSNNPKRKSSEDSPIGSMTLVYLPR